jgi:hypothetical protein
MGNSVSAWSLCNNKHQDAQKVLCNNKHQDAQKVVVYQQNVVVYQQNCVSAKYLL